MPKRQAKKVKISKSKKSKQSVSVKINIDNSRRSTRRGGNGKVGGGGHHNSFSPSFQSSVALPLYNTVPQPLANMQTISEPTKTGLKTEEPVSAVKITEKTPLHIPKGFETPNDTVKSSLYKTAQSGRRTAERRVGSVERNIGSVEKRVRMLGEYTYGGDTEYGGQPKYSSASSVTHTSDSDNDRDYGDFAVLGSGKKSPLPPSTPAPSFHSPLESRASQPELIFRINDKGENQVKLDGVRGARWSNITGKAGQALINKYK